MRKKRSECRLRPPSRRVGLTEIAPGVKVSTVLLTPGGPGGPAEWFQTAVFGGPLNGETRRWATDAEAETGHEDVVLAVKAAIASVAAEG